MLPDRVRSVCVSALGLALCAGAVSCGPPEVKYEPRPAYSGTKPTMPPVPNISQRPVKNGEAYTVWGAGFTLRSRVHKAEIKGKEIKINGYIVKTNLADAPECAVHKGGKADPPDCKAPIPTIWIGDTKDAPLTDCIQLLGWASNFAQLFDAVEQFKKDEKKDKKEPKMDTFFNVEIPNPLPVKGMKISVTAKYNITYSGGSGGAAADPYMGVLSYIKPYEVIEKVDEVAILPFMKVKP